ncbi:3-deoxy-manno-octulosonate cytidylyltransferase [bacterium]|nr:3-deoxy-manno-octulosonate cytidylyltransferase [bacterium]
MKTCILIPARMASARLPGKPLKEIGGMPMVVRVWHQAMKAGIGPVAVATDHEGIKTAIETAGGTAIMTPSDLPSGTDRIWNAFQQFAQGRDAEVIVNLQGDLPFIAPEDVRKAAAVADADINTLACPITHEGAWHKHHIVKAVFAGNTAPGGRALYFSRAALPFSGHGHKKGDIWGWEHIGIYAYRRAALERFVALPPSALEHIEKLEQLRALEAGMRIHVATVEKAPLAVDTPDDLENANQYANTIGENA